MILFIFIKFSWIVFDYRKASPLEILLVFIDCGNLYFFIVSNTLFHKLSLGGNIFLINAFDSNKGHPFQLLLVFIDCGKRPNNNLKEIATSMGANYVSLPRTNATKISNLVQTNLGI